MTGWEIDKSKKPKPNRRRPKNLLGRKRRRKLRKPRTKLRKLTILTRQRVRINATLRVVTRISKEKARSDGIENR